MRFLQALLLFPLMALCVAEATPLASVQVAADGAGAVAPGGGEYQVGTLLTFTATPGGGFVFGDWTDASGALLSPGNHGPTLEYLVTGDAQIVAHFAPSPFADAAGEWTAWLRTFDFDASGNPLATAHGLAAVALAGSGAFTGTLRFDAENFALNGMCDAAGRASLLFPRAGRRPLRVELRVKIEQPRDQLSLAVYDGEVCAMASVSRGDAAGLAARYTVSLELTGNFAGRGCATLTRGLDGEFNGAGSLANGTAFAFATHPGVDHSTGAMTLPVEAMLTGGGSLSGQIVLQNAALPVNDFSATLQWIAPPPGNAAPPGPPEIAPTASVFVGPLGADANDGTAEFPLATLDAALARIGGEGEIAMLPGDYEHASLNLATAHKVTLRSAPGHTARVFFGEKIMGGAFTHHQGNVWKTAILSGVPVQGSENRWWIFEIGKGEAVIPAGTGLPQQRLRAMRLDHFQLVQAQSIENVDAANGRYFVDGNMLYLRTSGGAPPRTDQEFRIPSQAADDCVVFGAGPQCDITLRGIEVYFACNGADVSGAASYCATGCKFFGSGNSGIRTGGASVGIEEKCEYAANANDGCSPQNYGPSPSPITVIDAWSHDNGDEGHSLHGNCRGFYFAGLYEFNANGGLTPAIGANAVIQGAFTRGNLVGINPAVLPPVNVFVADWTSSGDIITGLANWTSGLATVVDSRVLHPLGYSFTCVVGDARIAVFRTILQGGIGRAGGGPNITFSDAPLAVERSDASQAVPVSAVGSRYEAPGTHQRVAPFGSRSPNGYIVVRSAHAQRGFVIELAESFTLDTASHVTINGPNPRQLTLQIDAQTGRFTGGFNDLFQPAVTRTLAGVILQPQHYGTGFSPTSGGSAEVIVSIPDDVGEGTPSFPETTITAGPGTPANSAGATFTFTGTDDVTPPGSLAFECRLDGGTVATATSPKTCTGLADGAHAFFVWAINAAGNADPTPAVWTWRVDTLPPETTILSCPSGTVKDREATITFTANEAGVVFRASLDGGTEETVLSPKTYTGLTDGAHTFSIRAIDAAGNAAPAPATHSWKVRDGTPHPTRFTEGAPVPDAGAPADAVLASLGFTAIDEDGNVALAAKWTSASKGKGKGIFTATRSVAEVGDPVPGVDGATFATLSDPVIDGGRVAFLATLADAPTANVAAVFSDAPTGALVVVARAGDAAPGADGAAFKSFQGVAVSGTSVAFFGKLKAGSGSPVVTATGDRGLWAMDATHPLTLLLREGQIVGGRKIKTLVSFMAGDGSPGQGRGWLRTPEGGSPHVMALAFFTDKTQAVLSADLDGMVTALSQSGPGGAGGPDLAGANFASFGVPAANAAGHSAFRATLTVGAGGVTEADAGGIFFRDPTAALHTPVARTGGAAGVTGAKFFALKDPVLASDGGLAFPATIKGGGVRGLAKRTLWWLPPDGALTLLAQGGAEPAGLPGAQWQTFDSLAIAAERGPIFTATLVTGPGGVTGKSAAGVWAVTSAGTLQLLFRTSSRIGGKKVRSFAVLKAVPGSVGVTHSFNDSGVVLWKAIFTDGTQAIITTAIP